MLEELLELESPVRVEKEEKDLPEENFVEDNVSPHSGPHGWECQSTQHQAFSLTTDHVDDAIPVLKI